jgi:NNMT/PNMT/TEMT family protein
MTGCGDNASRAAARGTTNRSVRFRRHGSAIHLRVSSLLRFLVMTSGPRTASGEEPATGSIAVQPVPGAATDIRTDAAGRQVAQATASDPDDGHHDGGRHNDDVEWNEFAPEAYWNHNYRYLRDDDTEIIRAVGAFFQDHFTNHPWPVGRGIDIGSGSNLYPALAMLPWCRDIYLTDHSPANVAWLKLNAAHDIGPGSATVEQREQWIWQPFWDEFKDNFKGYPTITDPQAALHRATRGNILERSVFTLRPEEQFDLGTMFFVAESMTSFENEFDVATERFLRCLRPGSPFAAAFMDSSVGYVVADKSFPAVKEVTENVVKDVLRGLGAHARVTKVQVPASDPLRDGYKGMIIAVGTTGHT